MAFREPDSVQNVHEDDADNRHQHLEYPVIDKWNDVENEQFVKRRKAIYRRQLPQATFFILHNRNRNAILQPQMIH